MTLEVAVILTLIAMVVFGIFLVKSFKDEKDAWKGFEEQKLLWVPAEDWSAFGEHLTSLSNFRDAGDLRGYTNDAPDFEWTTQPDFMGDAMWVRYTCRKPEWSEYLRKCVNKINEHSERGIRGYSGNLPVYEEEDADDV